MNTPKQVTPRKARWSQPAVYLLLPLLGAGAALAGDRWLPSSAAPQSVLAQVSVPENQVAQARPSSAILSSGDPNFVVNAVDRTGPAVVRINSSRTVKSRVPAALNDPFFRQFFGDAPNSPSRVERGTGSGFIIKSDGLILTNAHVVSGADTVTVTMKDGRELQGKVLGVDTVTDVAVIKVESNGLPAVSLGNSDQLRAGEWAIAIGNPLGLDNTVTVGIVSATGRSSAQIGAPDKRVGFIQTDAAINPGNSGGPLLNQRGEVIGMNTAIRADGQGLGFAIPINTAQRIADQLVAKGKVDHPYLGIRMANLTPELRKRANEDPESRFKIQDDRGVLVFAVMNGSPAATAGLKPGDVILKVNSQAVTTSEQVQQAVENSSIGATLQVEVRRGGQTLNVPVRPGAFPSKTAQSPDE
ncbi:MAG TPA: HhoA/HhoB/HtrA family serine endopeptidase [Thermosynechococcaceae cyanobacterium]